MRDDNHRSPHDNRPNKIGPSRVACRLLGYRKLEPKYTIRHLDGLLESRTIDQSRQSSSCCRIVEHQHSDQMAFIESSATKRTFRSASESNRPRTWFAVVSPINPETMPRARRTNTSGLSASRNKVPSEYRLAKFATKPCRVAFRQVFLISFKKLRLGIEAICTIDRYKKYILRLIAGSLVGTLLLTR